jgi:hypothetical protein
MGTPIVEGNGLEHLLAGMPGFRSDRRTLLRRVAGAGLALPALGALGANVAATQDQPAAPVQPFALYDPVLPTVEAGTKDVTVTVTAKDATLLVAKDVAMARASFLWLLAGAIATRRGLL